MLRALFVIAVSLIVIAPPSAAEEKTLLAVFAHPDDESTVAPVLARYAREGIDVHVAIATDGRYGGQAHAGIPEGDELAAARAKEMKCAADRLGVELHHFDYHDQLRAAEGYDGHIPHVRAMLRDISALIDQVQPDAIITWGPDGGSNHMDHRLVGDTVTGIYLSSDRGDAMSLYYYGTPASRIDDEDSRLLRGVADSYMTTAVTYEPQDRDAAIESLRCHRSQFTDADFERMIGARKEREAVVYFRKFEPPGKRSDTLFEM